MNTEVKNKVVTAVLIAYFAGLALCCWIKPTEVFSDSERRTLEQFPQVSVESILSGTFMTDFEDYTLDQFPFRDEFRNIKAVTVSYLMNQSDNNGIYVEDGYVTRMEYPLNAASIQHAAERFTHVYEKYLAGTETKVYVSIVPDKNYFMAEESGHLALDYTALTETLLSEMEFAEYIDITGILSLEDYYKTDTHWRQECIADVAEALGSRMGAEVSGVYEEHVLDKAFYGVYYGQAALPLPAEEIKYLTSGVLSECKVYDYQNDREIGIYDLKKAHGKDPYELFLSGSLSLITIENPKADTDKELLLFRDSFGSSIAPLLAEGYSKITLVDIRYLHPDMLGRYIEFGNQDVLFLYSTLVLNHAETMK